VTPGPSVASAVQAAAVAFPVAGWVRSIQASLELVSLNNLCYLGKRMTLGILCSQFRGHGPNSIIS
jgi:hypothetical protein